jgi:hypothetical protein
VNQRDVKRSEIPSQTGMNAVTPVGLQSGYRAAKFRSGRDRHMIIDVDWVEKPALKTFACLHRNVLRQLNGKRSSCWHVDDTCLTARRRAEEAQKHNLKGKSMTSQVL